MHCCVREKRLPAANSVSLFLNTVLLQKVLHDDILKNDAMKRDPNEDEQLGLVRDHYSREIKRGPMDGGG